MPINASARDRFKEIFIKLDVRIREVNEARRTEGMFALAPCEIKLLGQVSLLVNESVSAILTLAQTADVDALLTMQHVVKEEWKKILFSFLI